MRTQQEIEHYIGIIEKNRQEIINANGARVSENSTLALLQLSTAARLDALYWTLGKTRPTYPMDKV